MSDSKLKVLIVDDSAFNRQAITNILKEQLDAIEIVGRASDGEEGLKQALFYKPDVITLDLNMPRLDGFAFLRFLMSKQPTPVIVVSSDNRRESVLQALELGALDFIVKPEVGEESAWKRCANELVAKIKEIPTYKVRLRQYNVQKKIFAPPSFKKPEPLAPPVSKAAQQIVNSGAASGPQKLLIVGASTGGPVALVTLLSALPHRPDVSMLIAQHMPENFTAAFARRLNNNCPFEVKEAVQGEPLQAGYIYLAPGAHHMTLHRNKQSGYSIVLRQPISIDRYAPSVNMLFESVATNWIGPLVGAVLTGMGDDGRNGALAVSKMGGTIYAESPESATIYGMPKEVWESGAAKERLPLTGIIQRFSSFIEQ